MKIFTAGIATETNTFGPLPTDQNAYESCYFVRGGAHPEQVNMFGQPLIVWKRNAVKRGWKVSESLCTFATPSGITLRKTYEALRDEVISDLKAAMPVDAVMLSLHGAMVADGYDDCEEDLVHHIRKITGPDLPLGVELDLHCHIGRSFIEDVTAVVIFKEYPHIDAVERAEELWQIMEATLDGRIRPSISVFDCRMIGIYHTTRQPMMDFVSKMKDYEGRDAVLSVSLGHCFPWADVPHLGARVVVVTDNAPEKGDAVAEILGRELWDLREQITPHYSDLDSAVDQAMAFDGGPVVLADMSDNPGGGGVGDSTFIMRRLLERGISDFAVGAIWDPVAVQIALGVGEGVELNMRIGGKISPDSGDPLDVRVRVKKIVKNCHIDSLGSSKKNIGDAACLDVHGAEIIIHSLRAQNMTPTMFSALGVDFRNKKILVVKSMQHFQAGYAPVAAKIIYVAAPGSLLWDFREIPYVKVVGPVWPLVEDPWEYNEERPW